MFAPFHPFQGAIMIGVPIALARPAGTPPPPPFSLRNHLANPHSTDQFHQFADSIKAFVHFMESESRRTISHSISNLIPQFQFQKRRLCDVLCVLSALGCCQKRNSNAVQWNGFHNIPGTLMQLQRMRNVHNPLIPLDAILPPLQSVSISSLTVSFLLCFLAIRSQILDIRQAARYLSRTSGRIKTTRCKLYQIAHILEAAGIITRSGILGQVTIVDPFYAPVDLNLMDEKASFGIMSILNRPHEMDQFIEKRRLDFQTGSENGTTDDFAVA
jgi:hypothetical protein